MDPNGKYFGYDINRLRQNLSGDGITQYVSSYSVTYSAYWNEGKPPEQQQSPPYLSPKAQTPAPDSEEAQSLEIEMIRDRIMGEQPGTTSDRATQWSRVESMLFFVQNDLFQQTDSLGAEWESPSAKEAYLLKVGETLAHIEMWREAAEANHTALYSLASAMRTAQDNMRDLWQRYEKAIWRSVENYLDSPTGLGPGIPVSPYAAVSDDKVEQKIAEIIEEQRWDLPYIKETRHTYNTEARQLINDTANSYASAISKLETARANRMIPMDAILHPEATGIELPSMPPGGVPGGPGGFGGPSPAPPGGIPPVPTFDVTPRPPDVGNAAGSPRAPGTPAPVPPSTTPRTSPSAPVLTPPNRPVGSVPPFAAAGPPLPGAPSAPGLGTASGSVLGGPPPLGTGSPPPPSSGGLPGGARGGLGMPGQTPPPPAGGSPGKPKRGKVLGDKVDGADRHGTPPPATGAPPGGRNTKPGAPLASLPTALESQEVFRAPPAQASPVLDTTDNTKKRAKGRAATERDSMPSVLSGARAEPKTPAKKQRERSVPEGAAPVEFTVPTGTAPVFKGRLAEQKDRDDRRPLGDVPTALRGPAAATLAEHQRHGAPQADRTTRTATPQPEKHTRDSWDVDTPGGPVVSSTKRNEYRAEPKKILGTRQH
ncbi:hypothetical protein BAY61_21885 [Prauserella marina]|uniref:Uncharacterized protein n=1 Tax=Prauserella marina TaxID=530584 RepID=A0A222VTF0_9PSEU|nr:hypothetical protein [Prauserella marina]ASR37206.1 hypothetical protein BAY61_21885 [Prauserella marina]PWV72523.1 hypothetical protein DES30_110122 [Prauserella marina]SDD78014.1 hypothetical protein SAMN05421630_112116 [Prauserella marina]